MECCIYGFDGLNVARLRRSELVLGSCCAIILLTFTEFFTEQETEPVHDRIDSQFRNSQIVDLGCELLKHDWSHETETDCLCSIVLISM